jgi:Ran GTPase-activating protein (RanGAP) involved in mRNA processing and transport
VKLQVLHLGNNLFSSDGIIVVANTLEMNEDLKMLYLNDNELESEGAEALGNCLGYNSMLTFLSISKCSITDAML